ncbi:MAG: histidine phosphatase family protein [Acidiferrobacterales bacterium]|jgi:probable phosphoglycerate mutase|nr:histidine phosphatase family protein [Acidiferrobacterales bacterium]
MRKQEILIDLMRHGEPEGGRAYRGNSIDDPLSDRGWQQMRNAVGKSTGWDRIVTSPLKRCRLFAEELGQQIHAPVIVEPEFREVGFGIWEGKTPDEIIASDPESYEAFYRDPENCRPEGAEPLADFTRRVMQAYEKLIEVSGGEQVLVVSHAGVMRAIIAQVLGAPAVGMYRIKVDNAGLSRIRYTRYGPKLEFHNVDSL